MSSASMIDCEGEFKSHEPKSYELVDKLPLSYLAFERHNLTEIRRQDQQMCKKAHEALHCSLCGALAWNCDSTNCCSQTVCKSCLAQSLVQQGKTICLFCHDVLYDPTAVNQNLVDDLEQVLFHCPHPECGTGVRLADMERHTTSECAYRRIWCCDCDWWGSVDTWEKHRFTCSKRQYRCLDCRQTFVAKHFNEHISSCSGILLAECCKHPGCNRMIHPKILANHEALCDKRLIPCIGQSNGCAVQLTPAQIVSHQVDCPHALTTPIVSSCL